MTKRQNSTSVKSRLRDDLLAIEVKSDSPVQVGTIGRNSCGCEPHPYFTLGLSKAIPRTN